MMKKNILLSLVFLFGAGLIFCQNKTVEYKDISFQEDLDFMTISIAYPEFPAYPALSKTIAKDILNNYKAGKSNGETNWEDMIEDYQGEEFYEGSPSKYDYTIDYEVTESEDYLSVIFMEFIYLGGAHGYTTTSTYTISRKTGKKVDLKKLVGMNYKKISQACRESLIKDLIEENPFEQEDDGWLLEYIESGTQPEKRFFSTYAVNGNKVIITFDAYAVAPYVYGPQIVELPLKK